MRHLLTIINAVFFLLCATASSHVFAIAPVLDLDEDDIRVIGSGYHVPEMRTIPVPVTGNVLILDGDGNKIARANRHYDPPGYGKMDAFIERRMHILESVDRLYGNPEGHTSRLRTRDRRNCEMM